MKAFSDAPSWVPPAGSSLDALIARVEAATGTDRELDAALCAHFRVLSPAAERERWAREWKGAVVPHGPGRIGLAHADGSVGMHCEARPLTASLDATLALVERVRPGWWWAVGHYGPNGLATASVSPDGKNHGRDTEAPTPALALILALLRALQAQAQPAQCPVTARHTKPTASPTLEKGKE